MRTQVTLQVSQDGRSGSIFGGDHHSIPLHRKHIRVHTVIGEERIDERIDVGLPVSGLKAKRRGNVREDPGERRGGRQMIVHTDDSAERPARSGEGQQIY